MKIFPFQPQVVVYSKDNLKKCVGNPSTIPALITALVQLRNVPTSFTLIHLVVCSYVVTLMWLVHFELK